MKRVFLWLAVPVLLCAGANAMAEDPPCDMKTVVKGLYCETCECLLDKKGLVSDATYYVCEDCSETSSEAGKCPSCDEEMKKKTSGKDVCKECFEKPVEVDVCVKEFYECPDCGETSSKAGKCADCEVALEKQTSRALIEYVCDECGDYSLKPGKCGDEECERHGKPLTRKCSESGSPPHVGAKMD